MINIKNIHEKYQEFESLEKTCQWLASKHNYKINRQRLSRLFKDNDLEVSPPNGWPEIYWIDTSSHLDNLGHFSADMVKLAYEDLTKPGPRINQLSAAWFLSSDFYEVLLETICRNASFTKINKFQIPIGLDVNLVIKCREIYERNRNYWLPQ